MASVEAVACGRGSSQACCPVCSDAGGVTYEFDRNEYHVYGCRECGVEFVCPQPSDAVLSSIYSENYFFGSEDESAKEMVADLKRDTANLYLDVIHRSIGEAGSRILEIGCGSGDFLVEARKRGFAVQGIEFSEHAASVANERLGEEAVLVGSPETVTLSPNSYDVLAAFDVIEHLRDPKQSIDWIHALLKPGGVAAIVTPSLDSWSRRLLGRHWMEYKPEHMTYFSQKSLRRLLENAGFSTIQFAPNYKMLTYDYVARHFDRFPVHLVSTITRAVRALIPGTLAYRKWRLVASGTMVIARKRAG